MNDLFGTIDQEPWGEDIAQGARLFHSLAMGCMPALLADLHAVLAKSPFRQMCTPRGQQMSVAMSNCGSCGWVSDAEGYRYSTIDPESREAWPAMPTSFLQLARHAAEQAGYQGFDPDACLINCYLPGSRLGLHRDVDEVNFSQPIVSASLGLPATFQFGGANRSDPVTRILLQHGDVLVWGGVARKNFHGILPVKEGEHPELGPMRVNLTFRKGR